MALAHLVSLSVVTAGLHSLSTDMPAAQTNLMQRNSRVNNLKVKM